MNLDKPSGKVICHSRAPNGEELITVEVEVHRFILPEINTHRVFSRNFQSSRAVPVEKMIEQVRRDPALPVHWGKNQRGMVADEQLDCGIELYSYLGGEWQQEGSKEYCWGVAAEGAALVAESFNKAGYHKQIVNRLLEPFMWTKGVITATKEGWESFFKLRCHKDAQPEIKLLAERIQKSIDNSEPRILDYGDYHLPYIQLPYTEKGIGVLTKVVGNCISKTLESKGIEEDRLEEVIQDNITYCTKNISLGEILKASNLDLEQAIKISTSCTAQVSYRVLDKSLDKALNIYDMLNLPVNGAYPEDPPHYSPTEHVARVVTQTTEDRQSGNFNSRVFWQYRKALEKGHESLFMESNYE